MKKKTRSIQRSGMIILVLMVSFACRLPVGTDDTYSQAESLEATIAVLQTQAAETAQQLDAQQSQPHGVEDVPQPTTEAAEEDLPAADVAAGNSSFRGFVAVSDDLFRAYDFEGNPLGWEFAAPQKYFNENEVSVLPNVLYYTQYSGVETGIYKTDGAAAERLDFITSGNSSISIAVSPDGNKIAWSSGDWVDEAPEARIYIANLDGSEQQMIAELTGADQEEFWRVYHPLRWTEDGTLIYATGMTGIGGYLLFWGYNGMYEYDPASGETRTLVSDDERLGLCLSSISHNREMAAIVCGDGDAVVRVRQLESGIETAFPVFEGQNLAGSAKFSSDDTWLAYVTQTQNYDDERGKVVVVPVDGSQPPQVVSEINDGSFIVDGWLDGDRFLVTRNEIELNTSTIWIMNRDGSLARELVEGNFVGLMP